jgi:biopolymer transport protein ExbD
VFKRPSSRRKTENKQITLNLVPILDAMVTLIAFLLFTMSFIAIVNIESPFPMANREQLEEKLKEKPLQLTVTLRDGEAEIWSPFDRVRAKKVPNLQTGEPDVKTLHEQLIAIKQKFPNETKIVFVPTRNASYEVLIAVMDAMRVLEPSDPPVFAKNKETGNDEAVKSLFPEVIFGNLLGDT